jgi:hypothetical protein
MNQSVKYLVIFLAVILACALVAWLPIQSGEKCTVGVYTDHPGLQAECLHQQTVSHGESYPAPGDPYPYPAPVEPGEPLPTAQPELTPTSPAPHLVLTPDCVGFMCGHGSSETR